MKLRIGLISDHASPLTLLGGIDAGGQNLYVGQLAKYLAAAGHEVDVFTRRDKEQLPAAAEWLNGVRIVHVPAGPPDYVRKEEMYGYMPEFAEYVTRWCKRQRRPYDLVHANFWMSGLVATELKRALDIPFVITFHALGRVRRQWQGESDGFPDERFAVEDRAVEEADHIIAECPQDEEDLIRLYNAEPARINIVPCGFEPSELSPISKELARVILGLPVDEPVVLHVGRTVQRKGIDNVIRGFARLRSDYGVAARLIIVGGTSSDSDPRVRDEALRLERIAREEGVAENVSFAGKQGREVLKYFYSAADMFATTPWYEPFGITPVEAMACGTPVVGSNVGGIKFSVRDGETGYLVEPNNPDALAERMAQLYQNPKLMKVFSRQALQRARALFTWQKMSDSISEVYENVLMARQPHRAAESHELRLIDDTFAQLCSVVEQSRPRLRASIAQAASAIDQCFASGGKLLICGNGGSAADSQHLAAEFVGRFRSGERPGLPAIALCADTSVMTAWGNDYSFEDVYRRQVEALGFPGDLLVAVSTSGRSPNVVAACDAAKHSGMRTVVLTGDSASPMADRADVAVRVPSNDTQRVQEVHTAVIHMVCDLVEGRYESRRAAAAPMLSAALNGRRNGTPIPAVTTRSKTRARA
jgi:phosphoheptose isomerase